LVLDRSNNRHHMTTNSHCTCWRVRLSSNSSSNNSRRQQAVIPPVVVEFLATAGTARFFLIKKPFLHA
jgi:hypothetical protein